MRLTDYKNDPELPYDVGLFLQQEKTDTMEDKVKKMKDNSILEACLLSISNIYEEAWDQHEPF